MRLLVVAALAAWVLVPVGAKPELRFTSGTPDDVRELALATWGRFVDVFPARWGCLADATLAGAWELGDRAAYDPASQTVTVRIPGTAAQLQGSMVHELAHHLELTCGLPPDLKTAFLAAQDLPAGAAWREGEQWEEIPSEQFAEAVAETVLGHRTTRYGIVVSSEAEGLIREWGRSP